MVCFYHYLVSIDIMLNFLQLSHYCNHLLNLCVVSLGFGKASSSKCHGLTFLHEKSTAQSTLRGIALECDLLCSIKILEH